MFPPHSRRRFLGTLSASVAAATLRPASTLAAATRGRAGRRPRVAILATEIRKYSHAQHFVDRFLEGYGWHGRHHRPPFELASLYVDQVPENDLSRERIRRHRVRAFPTIEEALTLGRGKLAVDGVLIIAEHGLYPRTAKGQVRYPRYDFFQRTMKVFEASGRSVPVFNDKHLSTEWPECVAMVEAARRLGFPFLSGSSLPVTWRIPSVEVPLGAPMTESVCVCYGGLDSYDIHGLETAQCMSERRAGGETGVKSIHALRGLAVWQHLDDRPVTRRLLFAALSRSFSCRGPAGFPTLLPDFDWLRKNHSDPIAYFVEHQDGFRTTMFLLSSLVSDFTYAGRLAGSGKILSCQMYLPMPPGLASLADFFNPLVNNLEQMLLTGVAPYPVERSLLTSGMVIFALDSLAGGQVPVATPELNIAYQAQRESVYWRA